MKYFTETDIKIMKENFDEELIKSIDKNNLVKIIKYLEKEGIYYAKDIILTSLDLFLLHEEDFIIQFEKLKEKLGLDYAEKLAGNSSLIELMYCNN